MSKPWKDLATIRFKDGVWATTAMEAEVQISFSGPGEVEIAFGPEDLPSSQFFGASDLREVAEFFNLLADQMEAE